MAWLVPSAEVPALQQLVETLLSAVSECGHVRERRPFRPHVTLMRDLRNRPPAPAFEPIVWPVREFCLVQSAVGPVGSVYTVLCRWALVSP